MFSTLYYYNITDLVTELFAVAVSAPSLIVNNTQRDKTLSCSTVGFLNKTCIEISKKC